MKPSRPCSSYIFGDGPNFGSSWCSTRPEKHASLRKHISLWLVGQWCVSDTCAGKHASLGICVQETRYGETHITVTPLRDYQSKLPNLAIFFMHVAWALIVCMPTATSCNEYHTSVYGDSRGRKYSHCTVDHCSNSSNFSPSFELIYNYPYNTLTVRCSCYYFCLLAALDQFL